MAKRRRSSGGSSFERLALFKAQPINRDTRRVIGYKPGAGKAKSKEVRGTAGVDIARPKQAGNVSPPQSWSRPIERPKKKRIPSLQRKQRNTPRFFKSLPLDGRAGG
jgi:hypothetical protein